MPSCTDFGLGTSTSNSRNSKERDTAMANPFSYEGKRVVLTGGATGVGAALLDLLAEIGAPEVTVLDLKKPSGPHATFIEVNLSDPAAVGAAIGEVTGRVDVLFNNAGVAATQA